MAATGFYFSRLDATGKGKTTASIKFSKSLTVVSGASDTGKSYLVQCLDFMTGGSDLPEAIDEATGYETLWLEIVTWQGAVYTLERSLKGGHFRLYSCGLAEVPEHEAVILKAKHKTSKVVQSASEFLLKLCALDAVELIAKKKDGTKWGLSFRPIAHLAIIDEEQIYTKRSPVHASGIVTQRTFEESLFRFFITGLDDSSVIADTIDAEDLAGQKVRREMLREIIDATEQELAELTDSPEEIATQIDKLRRSLDETTTAIAVDREELRQSQEQRNELLQTIERTTVRRDILSRLTDRFTLLDRYYSSDLKRLGAMSEAGEYLSQTPRMNCPICGTEDPWGTDADLEMLGLACQREVERIQLLRNDLSGTIADIQAEVKDIRRENQLATRRYERVSQQIADQLLPAGEVLKGDLVELLETQRRLEGASILKSQLDRLKDQLLEFEDDGDTNGKPVARAKEENAPKTSEATGFCKVVETVLSEWKFPDTGRVAFSERNQDIVINAKDRSSHGKGIRALSHAAFTVALMRFCRMKKRPFPGFVVLDSPLVAYREPDSRKTVEAAGVKESFYRALVKKRKEQQVIVFENEDPPKDIRDEMLYIHFSGDKAGKVRSGFFPRT